MVSGASERSPYLPQRLDLVRAGAALLEDGPAPALRPEEEVPLITEHTQDRLELQGAAAPGRHRVVGIPWQPELPDVAQPQSHLDRRRALLPLRQDGLKHVDLVHACQGENENHGGVSRQIKGGGREGRRETVHSTCRLYEGTGGGRGGGLSAPRAAC